MSWMRRVGATVGGLIVVAMAGGATVYGMSERKLSARYTVTPESPAVMPADAAVLSRGEHVVTAIAKCVDCHASDLGGAPVIDAPPIGHVEATNLTTGKGGVLTAYDDAALERAIRHGIAADGRSLLVMPSAEYNNLADDDLAALIAYLRTRAPVDRSHAAPTLGPVLRALWVAGKVAPVPAEVIAHDVPHMRIAPRGNSVAHGEYLAKNGCAGCHGNGFSGGAIPGAPPDWMPAANITPAGIGHYSLADFARLMREGKRPDGSAVDTLMPIKATRLMSDDEIASVFAFLRTVPAKPFGKR